MPTYVCSMHDTSYATLAAPFRSSTLSSITYLSASLREYTFLTFSERAMQIIKISDRHLLTIVVFYWL